MTNRSVLLIGTLALLPGILSATSWAQERGGYVGAQACTACHEGMRRLEMLTQFPLLNEPACDNEGVL